MRKRVISLLILFCTVIGDFSVNTVMSLKANNNIFGNNSEVGFDLSFSRINSIGVLEIEGNKQRLSIA